MKDHNINRTNDNNNNDPNNKKQDNNNDNKSDWKLMKIILILHLDNTYIIYKIYKYIINI